MNDAESFIALAASAGYDSKKHKKLGRLILTGRKKSEGILATPSGELLLWPKMETRLTLEQARKLLGVRGGPMIRIDQQFLTLEPWNDPPVMWRAPFLIANTRFWLLAWPEGYEAAEEAVPLPGADGVGGDPGGRKNWVAVVVPDLEITIGNA
jgi:hypothetical protein